MPPRCLLKHIFKSRGDHDSVKRASKMKNMQVELKAKGFKKIHAAARGSRDNSERIRVFARSCNDSWVHLCFVKRSIIKRIEILVTHRDKIVNCVEVIHCRHLHNFISKKLCHITENVMLYKSDFDSFPVGRTTSYVSH